VHGLVAALAAATLAQVDGPRLQVDLRYATSDNLTGKPLPGYRCRTRALMRPRPARALERAHRRLARRGLGLRIWDGYRPRRATLALVRWAERTGRGHLVSGGYIARRSNHNTGMAVDVTMVRLKTGRAVDMGSPGDALDERAHTMNARGRALRNRLTLKRALEREGFRNYWREWWHFDYASRRRLRALDRVIRCARE
jgi:zinc D-Ala-D-Ala dipeptidase